MFRCNEDIMYASSSFSDDFVIKEVCVILIQIYRAIDTYGYVINRMVGWKLFSTTADNL